MNIRKIKSALAVCLSAAAVMTSVYIPREPVTADAAASVINNPVIWSDVPDDDVIRVGDTYYMVSTTMYFSPGAPIMKSKDLVSWEMCGYVYDRLAEGDGENLKNGKHDYAKGQWAASLRYNEKTGKFYVFFGSYSTNKSYIYSTDDIENGEWSKVELNGMYHDASLLFDDDGRNYLVYGGGEIKIKELNSDMTGFKSGGVDKTLFKTNITGYVAGEGSHIQKIGDYYYIFIIAWPQGTGRVEICYRSKDLLGTYESKTILDSGVGSYGSGVAQGGIVETPDGKWYGMLFQDHGSVGRIPVLVPVTWQNDWPIMGESGKAPLTLDISGSGTDLAGDDSFDYTDNNLALEWQWNHNPDNSAWSVTERPGYLRLKNKTLASHLLNARNTLTMRTEGPACSSSIKLDTKNMKAGDYAGLSAFQLKYGCVGVYVTDSGAKKIYMSKNSGDAIDTTSNKIVEEVNLSGDEVYLKVDFKFADVGSDKSASRDIDKANFYYSYDGISWTKIGEELSMSYDLKLFTGYRSGIYSYATKTTGGYADIDYFDYDRTSWNGANGSKQLTGKIANFEADDNGYYYHDTFESGTNSWSGRGSAKVSASTDKAYAGTGSLYTSDREASWNGAIKSLSKNVFKPGETYAFSADAMYTEGAKSQKFFMKLQYKDSSDKMIYSTIAEGSTIAGEWVQLYNPSYTIPADASEISIYVETESGSSSFYVDEAIGAVEGTEIKGPKGVSFVLGDLTGDGRINGYDMIIARRGLINGKFDTKAAELNSDVNQDGEFNITDVTLIQEFVLGKIDEFPVPEKPTSNYEYVANLQYHANDDYLKQTCPEAGKVTKEYYSGINGNKALNVYTPYGYDPSKKYNVFYLMHGGGENENTCFSNDVKMQQILDWMIKNGEIEPMIVVTPTFNGCPAPDNNMGAGTVWDEMRQSIIPFVEGKYSTYAENTTLDGLKASRFHRAYGGFSMGGGSTWNNFCSNLDIIAYYMPLSGHCWLGAEGIQKAIDKSGLTQRDYFVLAATGDQDLAYGNMQALIPTLKNDTKRFTYTSDFSQGNFYFLVASSNDGVKKTHWWGFVRWYIYDALPYFFRENQ